MAYFYWSNFFQSEFETDDEVETGPNKVDVASDLEDENESNRELESVEKFLSKW